MTEAIIDPGCNFFYSSFYIKGIYELTDRVRFSSTFFNHLVYNKNIHCMAFVFIRNNSHLKIVIDFADSTEIFEGFISWCDIYGKVNYRGTIHKQHEKIKPVAPNYSLKLWNESITLLIAFSNYMKSRKRTIDPYTFASKYRMTTNKKYDLGKIKGETDPSYIFFASTYWTTQKITNKFRANFIRAARSVEGITFNGGLIPERSEGVGVGYDDVIIKNQYDYNTYITNTGRSAVVFNTPAYHFCHGWKLPEFLAMGKAIISTPFINELPVQLAHGENIWFVNGEEEEIRDAIIKITSEKSLRFRLEKGAREYYENHVSPAKAVQNLLNA